MLSAYNRGELSRVEIILAVVSNKDVIVNMPLCWVVKV